MEPPYHNTPAALGTMHGKERVIAPVLEEVGIVLVVPPQFDTDRFGTFTRERARAGTQREAARKKAHAAMEVTGCEVGIASEGSFGAHPSVPLLTSGLELVLLIDKKRGIELAGHHRTSRVPLQSGYARGREEARALATAMGFPHTGVIVRVSKEGKRGIYKDLLDWEAFDRCVATLLGRWFRSRVFIEPDLRAHRNPARMEGVGEAAKDLARAIRSRCPRCGSPGFVAFDVRRGLPCQACGTPSCRARSYCFSCPACPYKEERPADEACAPAAECAVCNP